MASASTAENASCSNILMHVRDGEAKVLAEPNHWKRIEAVISHVIVDPSLGDLQQARNLDSGEEVSVGARGRGNRPGSINMCRRAGGGHARSLSSDRR